MKEPLDVPALRAAVLAAYDRNARDLPWRRDTDPYRVLVSEVMLQQTRVDTVTRYYDPWLERFPSVEALARATEDEVLKAWEGLGYYRRARNLHRAARVVREDHGGEIPSRLEELRSLPGVGAYTAGAVASIAFGAAVPAVDGNVTRVLARLFDVASPRPTWLRDTAAGLVDPARPGDWTQALMELGATVCTPRAPKCPACPAATWCRARAAGTQLERPGRKAAKAVPTHAIVLAVIHDGERVLLEKRPPDGLLAGMWALPERRLESRHVAEGGATGRATALELARERGYEPSGEPEPLEEHRHRFTHLEARYLPWSVEVMPAVELDGGASAGGGGSLAPDRAWVDPVAPGTRALPKAQQRVLASWLQAVGAGSC